MNPFDAIGTGERPKAQDSRAEASAPDAARWLANPTAETKPKTQAQLLAEEPQFESEPDPAEEKWYREMNEAINDRNNDLR